LIGTLISLPSPEVAELLAEVGFDWLFIDTEHGPFDTERALRLLQAIGDRAAPVVRVPAGEEVWIKKALDIGAAGVIVPQVNSAEQAARVVRLCKYPPLGTRGVGIGRAHRYGLGFSDYIASANDAVAVIVQAEHIEAVPEIETIVRVPGVDAVLIGPYDLSASMGKPGQITDPEVRAAMDAIRQACLTAGVRLGIFGLSAAAVRPYLDEGFTLITVGVDTVFLSQAARAALSDLGG
jgi:2-keto-3-deoxy-L-rhamnonate aldolase RhmA